MSVYSGQLTKALQSAPITVGADSSRYGIYKALSSVLCERHSHRRQTLTGPFQHCFRTGKFTTAEIFTMLFVDFKAAFDSTKRSCLYAAMSEFGVKLIWLCILTLSNTYSFIEKDRKGPLRSVRY